MKYNKITLTVNTNHGIVSVETTQRFSFTMRDVAANTMLYMFAGYETSATTGQLAVYEMARHPELQQRARDEVNKVLAKYGGQCSYEAQNEMIYLNMVLDGKYFEINENISICILRMH